VSCSATREVRVDITELSGHMSSPSPTTLVDSERALILRTLEATAWVIGGRDGAATRLGLKRTTLIYKMQRHGIFRPALDSSVRNQD
jgi:formate hydrogenlyase transcriptional activator